jgi:hypothetical protein
MRIETLESAAEILRQRVDFARMAVVATGIEWEETLALDQRRWEIHARNIIAHRDAMREYKRIYGRLLKVQGVIHRRRILALRAAVH